jgi:hypothetical protein
VSVAEHFERLFRIRYRPITRRIRDSGTVLLSGFCDKRI